jgi:NAD-dependent DNA ligase
MVLSVQNEKEKNLFNSIEERKKRDLNNYLMNIDIGLLAIYTKKERQETFEDYKCM